MSEARYLLLRLQSVLLPWLQVRITWELQNRPLAATPPRDPALIGLGPGGCGRVQRAPHGWEGPLQASDGAREDPVLGDWECRRTTEWTARLHVAEISEPFRKAILRRRKKVEPKMEGAWGAHWGRAIPTAGPQWTTIQIQGVLTPVRLNKAAGPSTREDLCPASCSSKRK
ncbi:uncharacterized protein LOC129638050 isoform X2 [Bubalus kerabau]|uniref:uncharacterized protein LOC129638050 isoform X2 n=1 Tax=Bubalus carabanensis TaxID=3119969 RepID=UPI00244E5C61|nr:uncharacterized protein LOC129638050 isoform X2 [Bubalus carabanensis]XP_055418520.1 uncharacterized protein LOC129638050 isoform X2 [Bubalus carabanensis]XP_055418529.1 uncharacterized protein LOC129638050 isoform X2 [Bubalus carabanensis]